MNRNVPRSLDRAAILGGQRLGVRADPDGRDLEAAGDRRAREPADDRCVPDQMCGPSALHRRQNLVERLAGRNHDRLHAVRDRDVEQRRARVRRRSGFEYREPRRSRIAAGAALVAGLHAPGQARERHQQRPIPDVDATHPTRASRAEHLLALWRVGEPALLGQDPLGAGAAQARGGNDRIPLVLGLALGHHREPGEVGDRRCRGVKPAHPRCMKGRALTGVAEQSSQPLGAVAVDLFAWPADSFDVIVEPRADLMQLRDTHALIRTAPAGSQVGIAGHLR